MVTLAVAAAVGGGFLTAGSATTIGLGIAASVVDQYVVSPALFPPDTTEGPRVDNFPLDSSTEHSPMYLAFGEKIRVPVTFVWIGPLQELKIEQDIGGSGGGGEQISYRYFLDVDGAVCDNPVEEIETIIGEGKIVYGINQGTNVTDDGYAVTKEEIKNDDGSVAQTIMLITASSSAPALNKFKSGKDVTVAGYTEAGNNGTFPCVSATKNKTTGDTFLRLDNSGVVAEAAGDTVTITQGLPDLQINKAASIEFFDGDSPQSASSIIEAEEGTGNVPGWEGRTHFVVDRFGITPFGNRLPQLHAIVREKTGKTVAELITSLLERLTDLSSSSWDVTSSSLSDVVGGYYVRGPQSAAQAMQPVMIAYDVLAQEDGGTMKFFKRDSATEVTVKFDDLAAGSIGTERPRPIRVEQVPQRRLPSEVNVQYLDPLSNYQSGSQRAKKIEREMENVKEIRLPITMSKTEAKALARRLLWEAWANRYNVRFSLPARYLHIREGDIVKFDQEVFGDDWRILVTKVDVGADYTVQLEGIADRSSLIDFSNSTADDPADPDPLGPYIPPMSRIYLLNLPPMKSGEETVVGFYRGVAAVDPTASWQGSKVYVSNQPNGTFTEKFDADVEATMGEATTVLAAPTKSHLYFDYASTVDVRLLDGELESKTEKQVLNGSNWAAIGQEIVGFRYAELVGLNTYRLSGLLRGLRDTSDHMSGHVVGEKFVHLNGPGVEFVDSTLVEVGNGRYWKAIPTGAAVADFSNVTLFCIDGESLVPFRAAHVVADRDGSDNITLSWTRRTRSIIRTLDMTSGEPQLDTEGWEVDVMDGSDVVRTIVSSSTADQPSVSYTAAQQTTDGLTPGDKHTFRIYKISASVGRGNVKEVTV